MAILAVGVSHHHAPVDIREQFAFQPETLASALHAACQLPGIQEAVIINTCNRVELYASTSINAPEQQAAVADELLNWLHHWHKIDTSHADRFKRYFAQQAVAQLMRVSAGLDSLVLGEPQIGGQVKQAHALASEASTDEQKILGPILDRLFQQAFACAKIIRTDTKLGQQPVTIPYAVLSLARQIFSDLTASKVLLVGAGEMIELCARHFSSHPVKQVLIANRSLDGAQRLTDAINEQHRDKPATDIASAQALTLEQLPEHLHQADIVITSTASQKVLIDQAMVKQALKKRRHQPMLMVDIAVPRDIAPDVRRLRDVYLYSIDDLTTVLESNRNQRAAAAEEAELIVIREADAFDQWLNLRKASSMLQRFRQQANNHTEQVLDHARQQLRNGQSPDAVVEQLAHQLSRRLLHLPTTKLRNAIMQGQIEQARQLQDLFMDETVDEAEDKSSELASTPAVDEHQPVDANSVSTDAINEDVTEDSTDLKGIQRHAE